MYKSIEFRDYYIGAGGAPNTANNYASSLNRIDRTLNGLDEALARDGIEKILKWAGETSDPPFDAYPGNARSALRRYVQFLIEGQTVAADADDLTEPESLEPTGLAFKLEKEMQAGVRKQLSNIEAGLSEVDGGSEVMTATGRIDIVAKDAAGKLVVIELKAGQCPSGALEQTLGYAQSLSEERNEDVRALLIASDFSDRIRAAAKRASGLQLLTYEFSLKFKNVN